MNLFRLRTKIIFLLPFRIKILCARLLRRTLFSEIEIIYKLLKSFAKSKIMIDVGAHIGGSLAPFANCGWNIYAFEPDVKNREELIKNFGQCSNVKIEPLAISNISKKGVPFFRSDVSTGISTLSPFHKSHKETEQKIDVTTLTEYCKIYEIDAIDFLKIDVEGFDLFVLQGFPWEKLRPLVILAEFENKKTELLGYTFNDICNFLVEKGYSVLVSEWDPIVEYGRIHHWRRFIKYPCELLDENAVGNLIAVSDPILFNSLLTLSSKYSRILKTKN